jgi:ABC-type transport system involved in multi-copper enzyme maturation permease subunit
MTLLDSPALCGAGRTGTTLLRLIRAEIMKARTTETWWLFLIGFTVFTALALAINGVGHHYQLYPPPDIPGQATAVPAIGQPESASTPAAITASMMTSGQFLGVLFAMIAGILLMTNEFAHHTAATTFLTVPRRGMVVGAKLAAAACLGGLFWLIATFLSGLVTPFYLHSQDVSAALTGRIVVRSVLLSLLAFVMWAIFGLGLGIVVRSQVAAVVAGILIYAGSDGGVQLIIHLIYNVYQHSWLPGVAVIAPAVASNVMITPGQAFPHAPPQWAGLAVLAGYCLIITASGIRLTRSRDVT